MKITIPGNPADGSINAAYKPGRRGKHATIVKTKRGEAFDARVVLFARSAKSKASDAQEIRDAKVLAVTIVSYWDRRRRLEGVDDLALGDWDAPLKAVLDPMQDFYGKGRKKVGAGIFDDDVRIVDASVSKRYDPANPRIEVEIVPGNIPGDDL